MKRLSKDNINSTHGYSDAFRDKFGTDDSDSVAEVRFTEFFSVTLPKMLFNVAKYTVGLGITKAFLYMNVNAMRRKNTT
jgi:hypothetical protein